MASNGCSFGLDKLARLVHTIQQLRKCEKIKISHFFRQVKQAYLAAPPLSFSNCCDEHDLFYDQGTPWTGWKGFHTWLLGRIKDIPNKWFADRILRKCIAENLKKRNKSAFVQFHVPWCIWLAVRLGGWISWGWKGNLW